MNEDESRAATLLDQAQANLAAARRQVSEAQERLTEVRGRES